MQGLCTSSEPRWPSPLPISQRHTLWLPSILTSYKLRPSVLKWSVACSALLPVNVSITPTMVKKGPETIAWCCNKDANHDHDNVYMSPENTLMHIQKYAHGFVVLCFVAVMQSFIMNSHEVFIHIHQGCFAGTGAIVRLPQCQWSEPDGYW